MIEIHQSLKALMYIIKLNLIHVVLGGMLECIYNDSSFLLTTIEIRFDLCVIQRLQ